MNLSIDSSAISSVANPQAGDCASVAVALRDQFGGRFVCLYDPEDERLPTHVLVEKDGVYFDGTGSRPLRDFVEIHLVLNGDLSEIEKPEEYVRFESPPSYMVDERVVDTVRDVL